MTERKFQLAPSFHGWQRPGQSKGSVIDFLVELIYIIILYKYILTGKADLLQMNIVHFPNRAGSNPQNFCLPIGES